MTITLIFWTIIISASVLFFAIILPWLIKIYQFIFIKSRFDTLGSSSKIRLIHQLNDAIIELSSTKTGAIITIVNKLSLDHFRTDGIILDANISASLIVAIFNKKSPLHDGAIILENNKIKYASTYYKITRKSVDNRYGARHRAALGIAEQTDALTIVISEESGKVSFAKDSKLFVVKPAEFQEKLTAYL